MKSIWIPITASLSMTRAIRASIPVSLMNLKGRWISTQILIRVIRSMTTNHKILMVTDLWEMMPSKRKWTSSLSLKTKKRGLGRSLKRGWWRFNLKPRKTTLSLIRMPLRMRALELPNKLSPVTLALIIPPFLAKERRLQTLNQEVQDKAKKVNNTTNEAIP